MSCVFRQNGRLSKELDLVGHHVRTRLDELKRQEVSRLRMLLKAKLDSTNTQSEWTHSPVDHCRGRGRVFGFTYLCRLYQI